MGSFYKINGHNISDIIKCFNKIKKHKNPLIIAKTTKGKGKII